MALQKQKVTFFESKIADFFRASGRVELPWRKAKMSAYEVWVSEIMLQQTQVSRVIDFYKKFLQRFPDVGSLAKAEWEDFLPYYEGLGYYARGRNMLKTAKIVSEQFKGVFPKHKELLLTLPGIGDYTASAILSFAYKENHLAWDTNLKRVTGRFFYGYKKADIETASLEQLFTLPRKTLNAALMDFGSAICTSRPKCNNCPLQKKCQYVASGGTKELVIKKELVKFPNADAQVILFLHQNHRQYYSAAKKTFQPFVLPCNYNSRAGIKDFFLRKYGLQLSVRPPHQKMYLHGEPTILVNAQILAGEPSFTSFPKQALAEYTKNNL